METLKANCYGLLLVSLLLAAVLSPFLGTGWWLRVPMTLVTLFTVTAALYSIWSSRRHAVFGGVALIGLGMFAANLATHGGVDEALPLTFLLDGLFLGLVLVVIFLDILRNERVSMNTVFGACCIYILLALVWGAIFGALEWLSPGSFDLGAAETLAEKQRLLSYYSFITLTTVGYGDIAPVTAEARTLASLEALVGQLYLAIIIARLVGLELAGRLEKS